MNVSEAIARRVSVRAFKPDPIPAEVVRDLLTAASRAPSGGNLQPWRVYALSGQPLADFKALIAKKRAEGIKETPEFAVYPSPLWEPLYSRRAATRGPRHEALGYSEKDPVGQEALARANFSFFGAPVGLFFCRDRRAGPPQWGDIGMLMQNFMLLAIERGLDTCAQEIWAQWPQTIAQVLDLPENWTLYSGMALGYRDPVHPINAIRTEREPFASFAVLRGFP